MSLKDNWIDRQNGVDNVDAEDINKVARAVIEAEERLDALKSDITDLQTALIGVSDLIGGDAECQH